MVSIETGMKLENPPVLEGRCGTAWVPGNGICGVVVQSTAFPPSSRFSCHESVGSRHYSCQTRYVHKHMYIHMICIYTHSRLGQLAQVHLATPMHTGDEWNGTVHALQLLAADACA